jgi:hyperosmotically inducible protein
VALVTILFLFMMRSQDAANENVRVNANMPATAQQPQQQPVIIQQPAPQQQQPIVVQQPATSQPAPVIVTQPAPDSGSSTTSSGTDDMAIQTNVDKKISEDQTISTLGITAIVIDGKVTLSGTVNTETLKAQAERLVKGVKGVRSVENKIIVTG